MSASIQLALGISPHETTAQREAAYIIGTTALGAGAGYLSAHFFTLVNPVAGAIYGSVAFLTSAILKPLEERIFANTTIEKVAKVILDFIASFGTALLVVTRICGYIMPLQSAGILAISIVGITALSLYISQVVGDILRHS